LIEQEKYTEAEIVCVKLIEQYPEQIDGLHRYAELYEARGELQRAADYYHPTADFAEKAEGFGKISADFFRKKATQLES
jgi:Tfp pilus assembly protein PilF